MDTAICPNCRQKVSREAITCPYCRTQLKAYGHPGIPLHRAVGDEYLCDRCIYNIDDSCNFPQRPYAKECTLYQNTEESRLELQHQRSKNSLGANLQSWVKRNQSLLLLLGLLLLCFLIVLATS